MTRIAESRKPPQEVHELKDVIKSETKEKISEKRKKSTVIEEIIKEKDEDQCIETENPQGEYTNLVVTLPIFYDKYNYKRGVFILKEEMIVIDNRSDVIKIVNQRQAYLYVKNSLQPIRLEAGYGDKLVYVFSRSESETLFEKWRNHELTQKGK